MRIFCLANNWVGWQVLSWLQQQSDEIVGLALHPFGRQKYEDQIRHALQLPPDRVFDGSQLNQPDTLAQISALHADIALSVFFGYILRQPFIEMFSRGVINLHPAYLPYNRGAHPNVWSIIEGTPVGATLHYIDAGVDTGDIIAQQQVEVEPIDTGESLYRKLKICCLELFKETWPLIRRGTAPRIAQQQQDGTSHRTKDVEEVDCINLSQSYMARELINLLRARTFPPYPGAYFLADERKVYIRLQLTYEEQVD